MDFHELYKSIIISEESILELVDEYTLYCHYTGIEFIIPGKAYNAPYYRQDNCPSFSIFRSSHSKFEFMWKDHTTGEKGAIFSLIRKIENLNNNNEVLALINEDFALGYNTNNPVRKEKIVWYTQPEYSDIKIRIMDQPLTELGLKFWDQFGISKELLDYYNTGQVKYYWSYVDQQAPTTANDPTFYYRVGEYYQLYSPYNPKQYKFRNDLPENYFFGYLQLSKQGDKLVIDKSSKDVIFCKSLGIEAVSGKSETTMIPHNKIIELKDRFEEVYIMLDNDTPGRRQTEKYLDLYPWMKPRFIPEELSKDKTDLCLKIGRQEAEKVIRQLLQ